MLSSLERHLNALAEDYDLEFEFIVRSRWGKKPPAGLVADLKEFIKLLPKIEKRIYSLFVWLPKDSELKRVSERFLNYMYKTDDFIPEDEINGLFGYLDDAYIAAIFFELLIEDLSNSTGYKIKASDRNLLNKLIRLKRKARAIIPGEAEKIKEMIAELFDGSNTSYNKLFMTHVTAA